MHLICALSSEDTRTCSGKPKLWWSKNRYYEEWMHFCSLLALLQCVFPHVSQLQQSNKGAQEWCERVKGNVFCDTIFYFNFFVMRKPGIVIFLSMRALVWWCTHLIYVFLLHLLAHIRLCTVCVFSLSLALVRQKSVCRSRFKQPTH